MPSLLKQVANNTHSAIPMYRVLRDVLNIPDKPFDADVLETIVGLSMGSVINRLVMQESHPCFYEYSTIKQLERECERLLVHPIIPQYTRCVATLSYFEWQHILRRST